MLAIARALIIEPSLLILDEPSAGLSPKLVGQVFEKVRALAASGVAVLMVEQNAKAALAISDRGTVLVEGRAQLEGPARAFAGPHPAVKALHLGGRDRRRGMNQFWQHLADGILGAIIALGRDRRGASLSILRFANFAHGELLTVGAYGAAASPCRRRRADRRALVRLGLVVA
jgi:energy-coupling factor transporter ATP-binding protein EcfA2